MRPRSQIRCVDREALDADVFYTDLRLSWSIRQGYGDASELMRVLEEITKCVCFLGIRHNGVEVPGGTAFYVGRPMYPGSPRAFTYLVTAGHVIDEVRDLGLDKVLVRFSLKAGGTEWISTDIDKWFRHPAEPKSVDVAVCRIGLADDLTDNLMYPLPSDIKDLDRQRLYLGVGTEVIVTGLFSEHYGLDRNIPIVRVGNISAMPHEPIYSRNGPMDAYLIECRSTGGLSGSPVFANIDFADRPYGREVLFPSPAYGTFPLLGLIHGHYDEQPNSFSFGTLKQTVGLDATRRRAAINMGIAVVVPTVKIMEVIGQPAIRALEEERVERERERQAPTPD